MPPRSRAVSLRRAFALGVFLALLQLAPARPFQVVAYNIENLFDADGVAAFDDYRPDRYTPRHLLTKVRNAADLLGKFNGGRGAEIVFLNELEIDQTPGNQPPDYDALLARYAGRRVEELLTTGFDREVADLPAEFFLLKELNDRGLGPYRIVVGDDRPTPPGADRVIAQKNGVLTMFPILAHRSHPTEGARQILEVTVDVDGHPLHLFCNHWKSGASDPATEPIRIGNARVLKARIDELLAEDPQADIILGGDFNSQYNQSLRYPAMRETGINTVLGSQGNELAIRGKQRALYNLWFELPPEERGSDLYRDEWGTLMHLIVSRGLYDYRGVQYIDNSFGVVKVVGLNADATGRPLRWSPEGNGSGFSDHFPVQARFTTVEDNAPDRWLSLQRPSDREETTAQVRRVDYRAVDLAKVAVQARDLPPGTDLQDGTWNRRIFRVEGKVVGERPFRIEFQGRVFEVFSHDKELRESFWKAHRVGDRVRFFGELGTYRGRWQFIIHDRSWIR